jgi:hypothetical protein
MTTVFNVSEVRTDILNISSPYFNNENLINRICKRINIVCQCSCCNIINDNERIIVLNVKNHDRTEILSVIRTIMLSDFSLQINYIFT